MELINISGYLNSSSVENVAENRQDPLQRFYYTIAVYAALNVFLCFIALIGNSAILITLWKTPSLHSPANILLASLAVSDLLVGLVVQPLFASSIIKLNNTLYAFLVPVSVFLCSVSFYTTTAIGVDRLLALQLHLRYTAVVTPLRVTGIVTFIWVFSAVYSSAMLRISNLFHYALSPVVLVFLVVNFGVYLKIYLIVRRHQLQIAHQEQQHQGQDGNSFWRLKKSAVNTFLVYILHLVCYTPLSVLVIFSFKGSIFPPSFPDIYVISITILYLNSSINPFLYCWRIREIRTAMKQHSCC